MRRRTLRELLSSRTWSTRTRRSTQGRSDALDRRTIVCPCHDATLFDLRSSWEAGYRHPEALKRATAVFMGPCQGKMCAPVVGAVIAELQGGAEPEQRRPSVRPPLYPVRMGDLAQRGGLREGPA